ncbi:MAG: LON peptidase substrate-binding domain-containing protein [Proteobacteria bacterium]|nr:LON peptidase substrate-binding domain-containing protein [Pseudomonadota bacterium]
MNISNLPLKIPVIGIHGAVIFSDANLPIPMLHSQYKQLLAISESTNNIVGIVQPLVVDAIQPLEEKDRRHFYQSGTAVQIEDVTEIDDMMMAVHVTGLCRFVIEEEFFDNQKFRYAKVSYNKYIFADSIRSDIEEFDKTSFVGLAKKYMNQNNFFPNWKELLNVSPLELINFITMVGPLDAAEKQAILETETPSEQKKLLEQIMLMSLSKGAPISTYKH